MSMWKTKRNVLFQYTGNCQNVIYDVIGDVESNAICFENKTL